MPTTFRPARSGRGSHCLRSHSPRKVLARRPAIEPGASWGVGHGSRHGRCVEEVRHRRSRVLVTSRVTGSFGQQAWWTVGAAGLIQTSFAPRSPSGIGGRSRFSGQASYRQSGRPGRSGVGCVRRTIPRWSRSSCMTRAAMVRSGSRWTARASQSMYDGSNAAISSSRWPWNLPNGTTKACASSSEGRGGGRKPRMRSRSSGPVGCDARNGSRRDRSLLGGGWPASGGAARRRRVPRPERLARVDPSGHRPSRLRTRRTAAPRWRILEFDVAVPAAAGAVPCVGPRQCRIGIVDLRHQARRHP